MPRQSVLLLNPPAPRPTLRDYYCSSSSKGRTLWQPLDLLVQSGWLKQEFDLALIDAAATGWSVSRTVAEIARLRPAATLGLIGAAALETDHEFYNAQAKLLGRLFLSGDVARFRPAQALDAVPAAEGVLRDLTSPDLTRCLADEPIGRGVWLRNGPFDDKPDKGEFGYPLPAHELFWRLPYRHPFLGRPFASLLTDYGCPFGCAFCNSARPGWKRREPDDLFRELRELREQGIRWLFIKDMTFNADPERCAALLRGMTIHASGMRFAAYLRPDRVDDELARLLQDAGCAMAQLGIESGADALLERQAKGLDTAAVRRGCAALGRAGVAMGGHFVLGLPGESADEREATLALALELPLAYASFNLATPRYGSRLEPAGALESMDGSRSRRDVQPELLEFRRRALRRFYLRPQSWRRAGRAAPGGLLDLARGALGLLGREGA